MAWWNPWGALTGGIDLDEEQARAESLRKQELAQTEARRAAGLYATDGAYAQDYARRESAPLFGYESDDHVRNRAVNDARQEVLGAAADGAKSGLNAVVDGTASVIGGTLDTVGGFAWRALPWWIWAGGLLYAAYAFGLWRTLSKRFLK